MFPQNGHSVPEIRFSGFTEDWEQRKFADFTWDAGKRNKEDLDLEPYAITNEHGFIRQRDAHDDFGYMKDTDRKAYNIVQPNSFAYNPARINVGSIGYYKGVENVIVSSLYEVFQTDNYVNDRFLWHWLKSDEFPRWIEKLQEGSVRLYFYYDKLCECQLYMPSLEEQEKIASFLDDLDNLITLHQRKCEETKTLKKYMLQKMFPQNGHSVPEIRFSGFTEDWEQRKLDDVVEFLDTMRKPLEGAKRISGPYPYYGASGIVDYVDGYLFDEELILLSEDGANITDRNYPVCFIASGKYWVNNHAHVLRSKKGNENNFICNSLERKDYTQYNTGMAMPKLNKETCRKIPVLCPTFEEQQKIGDCFRSLDHLITLHQRKYMKYADLSVFDWEQRKLSELGQIMTGSTPSTSKSEYYSEDGIPWVTPTDIEATTILDTPRKLSEEGAKVGRVVPANTILCTCIASIGKNTLLMVKGSFNQQINSLTPYEENDAYFLLTESELWSNKMKRMAASGTMQIVNKTEFSELQTMVPKSAEQKQIGSYFRNLDHLITLHQRKCEETKTLKK